MPSRHDVDEQYEREINRFKAELEQANELLQEVAKLVDARSDVAELLRLYEINRAKGMSHKLALEVAERDRTAHIQRLLHTIGQSNHHVLDVSSGAFKSGAEL